MTPGTWSDGTPEYAGVSDDPPPGEFRDGCLCPVVGLLLALIVILGVIL